MFKAITKKSANRPGADSKGTLTALWSKAGGKADNTEAPRNEDKTPEPSQAQFTPAAGARDRNADTAAAPTTGGDVAIAAAPEPSPEPAAAAQVVAQVPAQPANLQPSKGGSTEKKRKRSGAADGFSEEQLTRLQALFAENEYANTAAKGALAAELGVELAKVNKWFEKQRKKARADAGGVSKRGRPKSAGASGSKLAEEAGRAADGAVAQEAKTPVAADNDDDPAEAAGEHEAEAMDVDVGDAQPAASEQAEPEGEQPQPAMPADAAAGPNCGAAAPEAVAAETAEPMAVEEAAAEPASAANVTPAAALKPNAEPLAEQQQKQDVAAGQIAPSRVPVISPAAAAAAPAKTPASAPQQHILFADDKASLVGKLQPEAEELRSSGLAQPLHVLPAEPPAQRQPFSDSRLAAHVAAQRASLSKLIAALLPLFKAPDSEAPVEEAVLRSRIVDLAARKSFAPKDGGSALVDAFENDDADHLWQWELRDQKVLPKELRPAAQLAKKRASRVQERLSAVCTALRLLGMHQEGKASAKLNKALDALQKTKTLSQVEDEQQVELEVAAAKAAAKKQQSAGKEGLTAEEKAKLKAEKEAAKEAERAAKEAEKERLRAEKEAEKERLKAEKEAEKEQAKVEKEAEKERLKVEREAEKERKQKEAEEAKRAKKTGYKDPDALKKTANKFMSFFQPKTTPGCTPVAGGDSSNTPVRQGCAVGSQQEGPSPPMGGGISASQQQGQEGGATGKKEKGYYDLFLKPEGPNLRRLTPQPSAAEAMDAAAGRSFEFGQVQGDWQELLRAMKRRRREAVEKPCPLGLPPTWARKSNAEELAQQHLNKLQESGVDLASVPTWRRKFIWFPADSQRPAFYGSCQPSPAVGPRSYLGQDDTLDYEVMSDLDWVEEPDDGLSLSKAEEEESEMAGGEEDEEHNSFICPDDYLSESEGVNMKDLEQDMEIDGDECMLVGAAVAAGITPQRLHTMQQLEMQMDRARRAGKPLIISRLPTSAASGDQPTGAYIQADPSLLSALAAEVLLPGLRVTVPKDLAAEAAAAAPATAIKASPAVAGLGGAGNDATRPSGGSKRPRLDDLLPDLLRMVQTVPRNNKNKITEAFLEAHQGRKVTRKWVQDMLKEHADWQGTVQGYSLKPAALQLIDPAAGAAAAAVALAASPAPAAMAAVAAGDAAPVTVPADTAAPAAAQQAVEGGPTAANGTAVVSTASPASGQPLAKVEPMPAATKAAPAAGGIERFLFKKEAATTPAVSSALRSDAPSSELKAPGRLVTTTAAGAAAAAASPLVVPETVSGTSDPFWRSLLQHIEGADSSQAQPDFLAAFQAPALARLVTGMPAGIISALVAGVGAAATPAPARAAYLRCLEAAVQALAAMESEAAGDNLSVSQQVWQPRGAPIAASLAELGREPQLLSALQSTVEAAQHVCGPSGEEIAVAQAGQAAGSVAEALLGSENCRAALAAPTSQLAGAAAAGGASPEDQLAALVAAAKQLAA